VPTAGLEAEAIQASAAVRSTMILEHAVLDVVPGEVEHFE
jgi:hypothetical protein